ncbi:MAG: hypothetical protein AAF657_06210 [Acidobacteriota bacterium]
MIETLIELVLDESKWLPTAMFLALVAVALQARGNGSGGVPGRLRILAALNLFYGGMIGIMAFGHLLAVTVKLAVGQLEGSLWMLYPIGIVLAIPSWWLVASAVRLAADEERVGKADEDRAGKTIVTLNAVLAVCLLVLGPHNLPLAVPAAWNIGYHYHSQRAIGWTLVTVASVAYLALFVGAMTFFLSGQSFEQFRGIE